MRKALLLLSLIALISLSAIAQQRAPRMSSDGHVADMTPRATGTFVLSRPDKLQVPIGEEKKDFLRFYRYWKSNDLKGMRDAIDEELVFVVESNTEVKTFEAESVLIGGEHVDIIKIQVLDGRKWGKEGWTAKMYLSEKVIYPEKPVAKENKVETVKDDPSKNPNPNQYALGDSLKVYSATSSNEIYLFLNDKALQDTQNAVNKDTATFANIYLSMMKMGTIRGLSEYTRVVFISSKFVSLINGPVRVAEVKVIEGAHTGQKGLVFYHEIK